MMAYLRRRTWNQYVYMPGAILERLPPRPALTDGSIRDWGVLIDIARGRSRMEDDAHDWTTARAELTRAVGGDVLARVEAHTSAEQISDEEKRSVLAALDGLIAFDSRLAERVDPASLSTAPPACGKWVDRLDQLLHRERILRPAGPGRPPTLSPDPDPSARRAVEWLQFGLVCSLYGGFGGLVQRTPHFSDDYLLDRALAATSTPLGDGWYVTSD
jgi:hypothetical protein